jgi:hypothetical protein
MIRKKSVLVLLLVALALVVPVAWTPAVASFDLAAAIEDFNSELQAQGYNVAVTAIDFFGFGGGRPSVRIHQQPFRWVAYDPRRVAQGDDLTYLVDMSQGQSSSGVTAAQYETAIDRAYATWSAEQCLRKVDLVKRADSGADPTIFDSFYSYGGYGNPFLADIVNAGFYPRAFFEAVGGPGGGRGILAFSVSFIFTEDDGTPTDINNDQYLDTALNEVYFNDNFGAPGGDRVNNPWRINQPLPAIDVQTVGLHENGHSLGLGHFGPPPAAVMNPVYAGVNWDPDPADHAGMCTIYPRWPR